MSTISRLLILVTLALAAPVAGANAAAPLGKITEFGPGLSRFSSLPVGVAAGPDGNVWFTDSGSPLGIGRITPSGQITEFTQGLAQFKSLGYVAAGADGNLWFGGSGAKPAIGRITPVGTITIFTDGLQDHADVEQMTTGADGNVWFVDDRSGHEMVGRITPAGQITEFPVPGTTGGGLGDITLGSDGNLWFVIEGRDHAIGQVTPSGVVTAFHPSLFGQNPGSYPDSITAGPGGDLWFTYAGRSDAFVSVGRMTTAGRASAVPIRGLQAADNSEIDDITEGPDGDLWMTDNGWLGQSIVRMSLGGQTTSFVTGLQLRGDDLPKQIVTGADNNLWFADGGVERGIGRIGSASGPLPPPRPTPIITCHSAAHYCSDSLVSRFPSGGGLAVTARLLNHHHVYALATGRQNGSTLVLKLTHITSYLEGQFTLELHVGHKTHNAHIILHRLDT
jgi:streptogramin lyase